MFMFVCVRRVRVRVHVRACACVVHVRVFVCARAHACVCVCMCVCLRGWVGGRVLSQVEYMGSHDSLGSAVVADLFVSDRVPPPLLSLSKAEVRRSFMA